MNELRYCEKHKRPYEIERMSGSWVYECPDCRKEGAYDTYAANSTRVLPNDEWLTKADISDKTGTKAQL